LSPLSALASPDEQERKIKASKLPERETALQNDETDQEEMATAMAATGTINERLMQELEDAANKEKFGPKTSMGKKMSLAGLRGGREKTPEEREAALEEARNLNGVNPLICIAGGVFAFAVAAGLWYATNELAAFFALHPVETDVYFVQRLSSVFRNIIMGLISLASGFFGVTGMGIFMLGVRVAYGIAQGELDPTPLKKKINTDKVEMPNVWDLMMNKKPSRSGGRGGDDKNPFGL